MVRLSKTGDPSGYTVLVVDDSQEYLDATRSLLEREGHRVLCANRGAEAIATLKRQEVDLMLLDYYMPGMTGEEVLNRVREFDKDLQIILQTGYASEKPPRELLKKLDIQGYHDKSEGPDKLLLWTDVGLKAAHTIKLIKRCREEIHNALNS